MERLWQVVDVYKSFGNTVLRVWDCEDGGSATFTLDGVYDISLGELFLLEQHTDTTWTLHPNRDHFVEGGKQKPLLPVVENSNSSDCFPVVKIIIADSARSTVKKPVARSFMNLAG